MVSKLEHDKADEKQLHRLLITAQQFIVCLPALLAGYLCLRIAEFAASSSNTSSLILHALISDLLNLARYLPGLFLLSLPCLILPTRRAAFWWLGCIWSVLLILQTALVQYFLTAGVPLGADLYAYSLTELKTTISGTRSINPTLLCGLVIALICMWTVLSQLRLRSWPRCSPQLTALIAAMTLTAIVITPTQSDSGGKSGESVSNLGINKTAFFIHESLSYALHRQSQSTPFNASAIAQGAGYSGAHTGTGTPDPRYPFLHAEQTPDVLGPSFRIQHDKPPNLVFLIVEGLGRSFSGAGARLGSFTPFLDELATQSLYWENFLATQGRTFAVLPSILASAPFGEHGFNEMGEPLPQHESLLTILKRQGYHTSFYTGTDPDFDNQRRFLKHQGIDTLVGKNDFSSKYRQGNEWGHADNELMDRVIEDESAGLHEPFVTVIQTITMHDPFTFPDQGSYSSRLDIRLDQLGIAKDRRNAYINKRNIYTSILYTDDALRRYFEHVKHHASYDNTIFIITGDHRLPELEMDTRIERYHVPLLIYSPLLKTPQHIRSVSSHFDITPSLLAFLAHNYVITTPRSVTWLGTGLDMEPSFRNIHSMALKQTKVNLVDYVSGNWFLNQDTLYALNDGLQIEPTQNQAALTQIKKQFDTFRASNDAFSASAVLAPDGIFVTQSAYDEKSRQYSNSPESKPQLSVINVHSPASVIAGELSIEVTFSNSGKTASERFVPLIVITDAKGHELSESYGTAMQLQASKETTLTLPVKLQGIKSGNYFMSVLPAHPDTGKPVGSGRYHIAIQVSDQEHINQ